ncbi:NAD-dependent epimerase/dehydratase family protein [Pseudohongiella sp. SYSU M77423]|uniref:NAD-dependent epimerase/dehydratase family protein n=1 Tax=Pseudohongiella sp. SYSU M77423 TaxID=3042312 RepID=UPI00247FC936|nr:NAD-dependent epimerase/dehydratase family protein [Pseudohongiella sp. SYSU M77423]MDH7944208.1 NAD-dependent epimerase/dehydratase family protein [Pseudohongiella sp. SYSU M77423]
MSSRVLVTGGSGFVGRHLVPMLQSQGDAVSVLQRPTQDLTRPESLVTVVKGIDCIYHLAAYAHVNHARTQLIYQTNVEGTVNLLEAAIEAGVSRFVYVSSILADPAHDQPRTAYGDAKFQAEQQLMAAHEQGRIAVTIIRPASVYGVGMKGNLMSLLGLIQKGVMPPLPDFQQAISLIGVQDLCQVLVLAAAALERSVPSRAPVYAVSDDQHYTIKGIEQAMRDALGKPPATFATPRWLFFAGALLLEVAGRLLPLRNAPGLRTWRALSRPNHVDGSASRQELGYNPRLTFYQLLPSIIADSATSQG